MTERQRLEFMERELKKISLSAEDAAKMYDDDADECPDAVKAGYYQGCAETSRHFARQVDRVLSGKTWDEALRESVRGHFK